MDDISIYELYTTFLNGGAPVTDAQEIKEWAEDILQVNDET